MKALLTSVISWGIASLSLSAQTWPRATLASGPETGSLMASAVDAHGRVHVVYTRATGITLDETTMVYRVRNPGSNIYTEPTGATFGFFSSLATPTDLDLTITKNFGVQVAVISKNGEVRVGELSDQFDTTWEFTLAGLDGSQLQTETGISIAAGADTGGATGLAYTKRGGTTALAGVVRYRFQNADGSWSGGEDVFAGNGSGVAPVLLATPQGLQGNAFIARAIVAYDSVNDRVHFSSANNFSRSWAAAVTLDEDVPFCHPDAGYRDGKIGVAWSHFNDGVTYANRRQRAGTTGTLFTHYDWTVENAVPSTETGVDELFGNKVALALDAAGSPQVAFTRYFAVGSIVQTRDVQLWRRFGALGWSQTFRDDSPSAIGGGDINLTTGLDLAMHANGDPFLVYERDLGANSHAAVARQIGAPWTVEKGPLLEDYGRSFAPALARGLGGNLHLVAAGSTDANPINYFSSKLVTVTPTGTSDVFIPSPGATGLTVAHAMTITPDGMAHIVGLRADSIFATTADVLYWSGPPSGPITLQTAPTFNVASLGVLGAPAALILESDSAGNLQLVYPTAIGAIIQSRSAATGQWTFEHNFAAAFVGIDFDFRADGGFALSYYEAVNREVGVVTNIDSRTGELTRGIRFVGIVSLGATDREVFDTACTLGPDGRPRIAYSQAGTMKFVVPNSGAGPEFTVQDIGINATDSTLEMVAEGDRYHILSHSTVNGGTLRHFEMKDSGKQSESIIATPGLGLETIQQRQGVAATLDANGFPVMAVSMGKATAPTSTTLFLARLGDSLDVDGDGLPLLLENAHCYNANIADGPHSLVRGESTVSATFIQQIFEYRRPDGFGANTVQGRRYADVNFDMETSLDLKNWEFETFVSGENSPLLNANVGTDEGEGCLRSRSGFLYLRGSAAFEEKRFGRLRISRAR